MVDVDERQASEGTRCRAGRPAPCDAAVRPAGLDAPRAARSRPCRCAMTKARLRRTCPGTMRDRLTSELLLARAAIESGEDAAANVAVAVGLAAPRPAPTCRWRWVPLPLPRCTPPAGGDPDRPRAAGAAVPALTPD